MNAAIELDGVGLEYRLPHDQTVPVLSDIGLRIGSGEFVAIVGASGSGKTSLLNILGLLKTATSGRVAIRGVDVSQAGERFRTRIRSQHISFVFQSFHLTPDRTVRENVAIGLACAHVPRTYRPERVARAIDAVGLTHRISARAATLSGGEQQRVAIARALARDSAVILADEPTGNLDKNTAAGVLYHLSDARGPRTSLVLVTHDDDIAARADRVLELQHGTLTPAGGGS